jgi:hypothetical protein
MSGTATSDDVMMYETPVAKGVSDRKTREVNMRIQQYRTEADFKPIVNGSFLENTPRRVLAWPFMTDQVYNKHPKCVGDINHNVMKCPDNMYIDFDDRYRANDHITPAIKSSFLNAVKELSDIFSMLIQQSHLGTISGNYAMMDSEEIFFAHELMKKSFHENVNLKQNVPFYAGKNETKHTFNMSVATCILKYKIASALGIKREEVEKSLRRLYDACCPTDGEALLKKHIETALKKKMEELEKMDKKRKSKQQQQRQGSFMRGRGGGRGFGRGRGRGGRGIPAGFTFDSDDDDDDDDDVGAFRNNVALSDDDDDDEDGDAFKTADSFDKEAFIRREKYDYMAKIVGARYNRQNQMDIFCEDASSQEGSERPTLDSSFLNDGVTDMDVEDGAEETSSRRREEGSCERPKKPQQNRTEEKIKIFFRMLHAKDETIDGDHNEDKQRQTTSANNDGGRMSFETLVQERAQDEDEPMVRLTIGERKKKIVGWIIYAVIMDPNFSTEDAMDCLLHRSFRNCLDNANGSSDASSFLGDDIDGDGLSNIDRHFKISRNVSARVMEGNGFGDDNYEASFLDNMLTVANGQGCAGFDDVRSKSDAYGLFETSNQHMSNIVGRYKVPMQHCVDENHRFHNMDPMIRGGLGLCRWTETESLFGLNKTCVSSNSFDFRMWQSQADLFNTILNPKKKNDGSRAQQPSQQRRQERKTNINGMRDAKYETDTMSLSNFISPGTIFSIKNAHRYANLMGADIDKGDKLIPFFESFNGTPEEISKVAKVLPWLNAERNDSECDEEEEDEEKSQDATMGGLFPPEEEDDDVVVGEEEEEEGGTMERAMDGFDEQQISKSDVSFMLWNIMGDMVVSLYRAMMKKYNLEKIEAARSMRAMPTLADDEDGDERARPHDLRSIVSHLNRYGLTPDGFESYFFDGASKDSLIGLNEFINRFTKDCKYPKSISDKLKDRSIVFDIDERRSSSSIGRDGIFCYNLSYFEYHFEGANTNSVSGARISKGLHMRFLPGCGDSVMRFLSEDVLGMSTIELYNGTRSKSEQIYNAESADKDDGCGGAERTMVRQQQDEDEFDRPDVSSYVKLMGRSTAGMFSLKRNGTDANSVIFNNDRLIKSKIDQLKYNDDFSTNVTDEAITKCVKTVVEMVPQPTDYMNHLEWLLKRQIPCVKMLESEKPTVNDVRNAMSGYTGDPMYNVHMCHGISPVWISEKKGKLYRLYLRYCSLTNKFKDRFSDELNSIFDGNTILTKGFQAVVDWQRLNMKTFDLRKLRHNVEQCALFNELDYMARFVRFKMNIAHASNHFFHAWFVALDAMRYELGKLKLGMLCSGPAASSKSIVAKNMFETMIPGTYIPMDDFSNKAFNVLEDCSDICYFGDEAIREIANNPDETSSKSLVFKKMLTEGFLMVLVLEFVQTPGGTYRARAEIRTNCSASFMFNTNKVNMPDAVLSRMIRCRYAKDFEELTALVKKAVNDRFQSTETKSMSGVDFDKLHEKLERDVSEAYMKLHEKMIERFEVEGKSLEKYFSRMNDVRYVGIKGETIGSSIPIFDDDNGETRANSLAVTTAQPAKQISKTLPKTSKRDKTKSTALTALSEDFKKQLKELQMPENKDKLKKLIETLQKTPEGDAIASKRLTQASVLHAMFSEDMSDPKNSPFFSKTSNRDAFCERMRVYHALDALSLKLRRNKVLPETNMSVAHLICLKFFELLKQKTGITLSNWRTYERIIIFADHLTILYGLNELFRTEGADLAESVLKYGFDVKMLNKLAPYCCAPFELVVTALSMLSIEFINPFQPLLIRFIGHRLCNYPTKKGFLVYRQKAIENVSSFPPLYKKDVVAKTTASSSDAKKSSSRQQQRQNVGSKTFAQQKRQKEATIVSMLNDIQKTKRRAIGDDDGSSGSSDDDAEKRAIDGVFSKQNGRSLLFGAADDGFSNGSPSSVNDSFKLLIENAYGDYETMCNKYGKRAQAGCRLYLNEQVMANFKMFSNLYYWVVRVQKKYCDPFSLLKSVVELRDAYKLAFIFSDCKQTEMELTENYKLTKDKIFEFESFFKDDEGDDYLQQSSCEASMTSSRSENEFDDFCEDNDGTPKKAATSDDGGRRRRNKKRRDGSARRSKERSFYKDRIKNIKRDIDMEKLRFLKKFMGKSFRSRRKLDPYAYTETLFVLYESYAKHYGTMSKDTLKLTKHAYQFFDKCIPSFFTLEDAINMKSEYDYTLNMRECMRNGRYQEATTNAQSEKPDSCYSGNGKKHMPDDDDVISAMFKTQQTQPSSAASEETMKTTTNGEKIKTNVTRLDTIKTVVIEYIKLCNVERKKFEERMAEPMVHHHHHHQKHRLSSADKRRTIVPMSGTASTILPHHVSCSSSSIHRDESASKCDRSTERVPYKMATAMIDTDGSNRGDASKRFGKTTTTTTTTTTTILFDEDMMDVGSSVAAGNEEEDDRSKGDERGKMMIETILDDPEHDVIMSARRLNGEKSGSEPPVSSVAMVVANFNQRKSKTSSTRVGNAGESETSAMINDDDVISPGARRGRSVDRSRSNPRSERQRSKECDDEDISTKRRYRSLSESASRKRQQQRDASHRKTYRSDRASVDDTDDSSCCDSFEDEYETSFSIGFSNKDRYSRFEEYVKTFDRPTYDPKSAIDDTLRDVFCMSQKTMEKYNKSFSSQQDKRSPNERKSQQQTSPRGDANSAERDDGSQRRRSKRQHSFAEGKEAAANNNGGKSRSYIFGANFKRQVVEKFEELLDKTQHLKDPIIGLLTRLVTSRILPHEMYLCRSNGGNFFQTNWHTLERTHNNIDGATGIDRTSAFGGFSAEDNNGGGSTEYGKPEFGRGSDFGNRNNGGENAYGFNLPNNRRMLGGNYDQQIVLHDNLGGGGGGNYQQQYQRNRPQSSGFGVGGYANNKNGSVEYGSTSDRMHNLFMDLNYVEYGGQLVNVVNAALPTISMMGPSFEDFMSTLVECKKKTVMVPMSYGKPMSRSEIETMGSMSLDDCVKMDYLKLNELIPIVRSMNQESQETVGFRSVGNKVLFNVHSLKVTGGISDLFESIIKDMIYKGMKPCDIQFGFMSDMNRGKFASMKITQHDIDNCGRDALRIDTGSGQTQREMDILNTVYDFSKNKMKAAMYDGETSVSENPSEVDPDEHDYGDIKKKVQSFYYHFLNKQQQPPDEENVSSSSPDDVNRKNGANKESNEADIIENWLNDDDVLSGDDDDEEEEEEEDDMSENPVSKRKKTRMDYFESLKKITKEKFGMIPSWERGITAESIMSDLFELENHIKNAFTIDGIVNSKRESNHHVNSMTSDEKQDAQDIVRRNENNDTDEAMLDDGIVFENGVLYMTCDLNEFAFKRHFFGSGIPMALNPRNPTELKWLYVFPEEEMKISNMTMAERSRYKPLVEYRDFPTPRNQAIRALMYTIMNHPIGLQIIQDQNIIEAHFISVARNAYKHHFVRHFEDVKRDSKLALKAQKRQDRRRKRTASSVASSPSIEEAEEVRSSPSKVATYLNILENKQKSIGSSMSLASKKRDRTAYESKDGEYNATSVQSNDDRSKRQKL